MRQKTEVLRLAAGGLSLREISRSLGIGHTTAREHLERARWAGLSWPLPPELTEAELEARLYPSPATPAGPRPLPDWLAVHRDLKRSKHVTLKLLWLEYREVHPDGLGYSQFSDRYRQWAGRQDVVMRLSYPAGERIFVDFCGDTVPVVDRQTGEIRQAQVFVAALGFSGYLYAEAFWSQDLGSWLTAHVHAFEAAGGVPRLLVTDYVARHIIRHENAEDPAEEVPAFLEALDDLAQALAVGRPAELVAAHARGQDQSLHDTPSARHQAHFPEPAEVGLQLVPGLTVGDRDRLPLTADLLRERCRAVAV